MPENQALRAIVRLRRGRHRALSGALPPADSAARRSDFDISPIIAILVLDARRRHRRQSDPRLTRADARCPSG